MRLGKSGGVLDTKSTMARGEYKDCRLRIPDCRFGSPSDLGEADVLNGTRIPLLTRICAEELVSRDQGDADEAR